MELKDKAAVRARLERILTSPQVSAEEDLKFVRETCEALQTRLCNLLPNRTDLNEVFKREFDIDIVMNMVQYKAIEWTDTESMVEIIFQRLKLCCAPIQDDAVAHTESCLRQETNLPRKMASTIELAHDILADIEKLKNRMPM